MNKLLTLIIAGAFCVNVFAADSTSTEVSTTNEKRAVIAQFGSEVADSIKSTIKKYQTEITTLRTENEAQREEFQAKIAALRDSSSAAVKEFKGMVPDSVKAMINQRRDAAKEDLKTALDKVDQTQKAKFEKALSQLEKKLAERQFKAEEAKAKLEAKKAEILKKIETKETVE